MNKIKDGSDIVTNSKIDEMTNSKITKDKGSKPKIKKRKVVKSDALFKSIISDKLAAREFVEFYLNQEDKPNLNLSTIKIEKNMYRK